MHTYIHTRIPLYRRVAPVLPNMPEVRTPSEFKNKFVLLVEVVAFAHPFINLTQADKAVGDVG